MNIDPRRIVQIVLVATEDQPAIDGYPKPQTLPLSAWAAVNKTCHAATKALPEPPIFSQIVKGAGLKNLGEGATALAFELMSKLDGKAITYLQFKTVPAHPKGRSGPKEFALLTICRDDTVPRSDVVRVENGELIPAAGGSPCDPPELTQHIARNQVLWSAWMSLGVTEQTELPVDFQFHATKQSAAEALREALVPMGMTVTLKPTRTLLIFKGCEMHATETAKWTLERLQMRTRELFEAAATQNVSLEGVGASIASPER